MKDHHHQEINSPYLAGLQNHFRSGLFAPSKLNIHIVSIAMAGASLRERTVWKKNAYRKFSGVAEEELSTTSGSLYKFAPIPYERLKERRWQLLGNLFTFAANLRKSSFHRHRDQIRERRSRRQRELKSTGEK